MDSDLTRNDYAALYNKYLEVRAERNRLKAQLKRKNAVIDDLNNQIELMKAFIQIVIEIAHSK